MSDGEIIYEIRGSVGWIVLNRPQVRNALTFGMYQRVAEICAGIAEDRSLSALVITGAGEKAFAAGTDMTQFREFREPQDALDYEHRMDAVLQTIETCPVPTIAAIAGACTGGGAGIAAACDLRIATADMKFGFPIARTLGNCLSIANLSRLSDLMGAGRVRELVLRARLIGAEEALRIGLVTAVAADHAELLARANELADELSGHAPITMRVTKEALRRLRLHGAGADDDDLVTEAFMSDDFREGREAFLAKRKPQWRGQ